MVRVADLFLFFDKLLEVLDLLALAEVSLVQAVNLVLQVSDLSILL